MLFNSWAFLFAFLPVTYFIFWRLKKADHRYIWLTITGYFFYGYWNYKFCFLMMASTLISYFAGLGMLKWEDQRRRKLCLVIPVTLDLLFLGFFKYANFFIQTLGDLHSFLGGKHSFPVLDIVLPVGISFYTFHTITYIVDGYRGVIKPTRNFFEFSCYVSLFSQLVAGPIVRFREIESDMENIARADRKQGLSAGWSFFAIGMVKKVLIADTIAAVINPALGSLGTLSTPGAWACALGYAYQLYFDFSGYSDMAVGLGLLFGLRLPRNFNSPYKASGIGDFWRRWHISLSTVLRDYLYIPLGGKHAAYRNVMITMLLGGLWHGAHWTFVLWGGYHGILLVTERRFKDVLDRMAPSLRRGMTFLLVLIGWVLFRSADLSMAVSWLKKMFLWAPGPLMPGYAGLLFMLIVASFVAHAVPNTFEFDHRWRPLTVIGLIVLFALSVLVMAAGNESPFLYFQF